jgi:hypothetical protein
MMPALCPEATAARKKVEQDRLLGVASGAKRLLSAAAHWLFERDGFHGQLCTSLMHRKRVLISAA